MQTFSFFGVERGRGRRKEDRQGAKVICQSYSQKQKKANTTTLHWGKERFVWISQHHAFFIHAQYCVHVSDRDAKTNDLSWAKREREMRTWCNGGMKSLLSRSNKAPRNAVLSTKSTKSNNGPKMPDSIQNERSEMSFFSLLKKTKLLPRNWLLKLTSLTLFV